MIGAGVENRVKCAVGWGFRHESFILAARNSDLREWRPRT